MSIENRLQLWGYLFLLLFYDSRTRFILGCFKSINSFRKPHESRLKQFKAWKIAQLGNCKSLTIKLVGEIVCHLLAIFLLNSLAMLQNQAWPNLHNTSFVCNIIFVILTCFHLTNFFGEEKISWLPSKNKVVDEKT